MAKRTAIKTDPATQSEPTNTNPNAQNRRPATHLKLRLEDLKSFDPLTDNQRKFFSAYKQGDYFIALHGVAGTGKAQPLDAKVLTPTGWRLMGDLIIGDLVVTPEGSSASIINIFPQGEKEIFKITFHDGSSTRACAEHLWSVRFNVDPHSERFVVNTKKIIDSLESGQMVFIDTINPSVGTIQDLEVDPYLLGVLLGCGELLGDVAFNTSNDFVIDHVRRMLLEGYGVNYNNGRFVIENAQAEDKNAIFVNHYRRTLHNIGLFGRSPDEFHIPDVYTRSRIDQRLDLIRGMFDSGASINKRGEISFSTLSYKLATNLQEMLWSVGAVCSITQHHDKTSGKLLYILRIEHSNSKMLFYSPFKRENVSDNKNVYRSVSSVESVGTDQAQCILIDSSDHLYVTDDYIITHNTFCALYKAIEEVLDKSNPFNKIIVVRSAVQGREMGHLPGDVNDKMEIYQQPYRQICETLFGRRDAWDRLAEQHHIEFISTSFIRGMSFDDAIVIVDEAQNCNFQELQTVITRVGYRSKIVFCGDYRQTDLLKNKNDVSGIKRFLDIAQTMSSFTRIEFTVDDIVRSSLVRDWIVAETAFNDKEWHDSLPKLQPK